LKFIGQRARLKLEAVDGQSPAAMDQQQRCTATVRGVCSDVAEV
jgi:hypothetical protein